jgi:hypothetical protein
MGFWSGLGKGLKAIGKGALKAAPIAASFIPGVGIPAAMGIGALTKGLSNKFSGGSFLGGALEGGMEGGIGGLAKKAMFGGFKGLNPSGNFWNKMGRSVMGGSMGRPISRGYGTPPFVPQNQSYTQMNIPGRKRGAISNAYGGNQFAQSVANNSRAFTMGY